jgi:armadillo repeat-containing protein 4
LNVAIGIVKFVFSRTQFIFKICKKFSQKMPSKGKKSAKGKEKVKEKETLNVDNGDNSLLPPIPTGRRKSSVSSYRRKSVAGSSTRASERHKGCNSDSSESTDVVSSSDDEDRWKERSIKQSDLPSEYWHIQKLVKYMKAGNQTATVVALCCLKDHDLTTQINQIAIQEIGGLEVLVNLLESNDLKCRFGSLTVLSAISLNLDIRRSIVDLGGIPLLVNILSEPSKELKILAAETIANVGKVRLARKLVRRFGGIPKVVDLLDVPLTCLTTPQENLTKLQKEQLSMATAGARALWSLSESIHNKEIMRKSGIVPLMARLLQSIHIEVVVPIMGCVQQCATQGDYQLAIATEGMIQDIVVHLSSDNFDLKMQCSSAIFKCASDKMARDIVREAGGLESLVAIVKDKSIRENKALLAGNIKCDTSFKIYLFKYQKF